MNKHSKAGSTQPSAGVMAMSEWGEDSITEPEAETKTKIANTLAMSDRVTPTFCREAVKKSQGNPGVALPDRLTLVQEEETD